MTVERYGNTVELRADGRTLRGVVVPYGQAADPSRAMRQLAGGAKRERFAVGSYVASMPTVPLNIEHRALQAAAWYPDGGLQLMDSAEALRFEATLPGIPAADLALDGVRNGKFRGVSLEFRALNESRQGGERIIEAFELHGVGLTGRPIYSGSTVEARQLETAAVRGTIQADGGQVYDCDCVGSKDNPVCKVRFEVGSFDKAIERSAVAREQTARRRPLPPMMPVDVPQVIPAPVIPPAAPVAEAQNIVAHTGSFRPGSILGDTNSGVLVLSLIGNLLNIGLEDAALETAAGRELAEAVNVGEVHARPLIDFDRSEYTDEDEIRTYTDVWLTSILFKTALRTDGWLAVVLGYPIVMEQFWSLRIVFSRHITAVRRSRPEAFAS